MIRKYVICAGIIIAMFMFAGCEAQQDIPEGSSSEVLLEPTVLYDTSEENAITRTEEVPVSEADLPLEQRQILAAIAADMVRQYENDSIDPFSQAVIEQRFNPAPDGISFPQILEDDIEGGVASFVIYDNTVMGGYDVELPCPGENGTIFMYLWLVEKYEEPEVYEVYSVRFSESRLESYEVTTIE